MNLSPQDLNILDGETLHLPRRFAELKANLIKNHATLVAASFKRLIRALRNETAALASASNNVIPTLPYSRIDSPADATAFAAALKLRGVGVIRGVVPDEEAAQWRIETQAYLEGFDPERTSTAPQLLEVFWSPAQIKVRAHANLLAAQRFVMSLWTCSEPDVLIGENFPIVYADRLRVNKPLLSFADMLEHLSETISTQVPYDMTQMTVDSGPIVKPAPGPWSPADFIRAPGNGSSNIDGGSVERWEPDGYGSTYTAMFEGRWEDYDPWESSQRVKATPDLYNGVDACGTFRMFQGWISVGEYSLNREGRSDESRLRICPMIKLVTAYLLLRPFFRPIRTAETCETLAHYLHEDNWILESPPSSALHGAWPGFHQELNSSLHPHLDLERTMIPIQHLQPGDYIVWHPDSLHDFRGPPPSTPRTPTDDLTGFLSPFPFPTSICAAACPLTVSNALYMIRQRRNFLQLRPGPDFDVGGRVGAEAAQLMRPTVQDIANSGGDEALRAMGLIPWDEQEASTDVEWQLLRLANDILFPDGMSIPPVNITIKNYR